MSLSQSPPIRYQIAARNPAAHLFEVSVAVDDPAPDGQQFMLPVWIPGSYMIREFARNIVAIRAEAGGKPVGLKKIDKATWQCEPSVGPIVLTYDVYAWDLSVRGAHLDETHGFFNGVGVFLLPIGHENAACDIEIFAPQGVRFIDWRVATSLSQKPALAGAAGQKASKTSVDAGVSPVSPKSFGHFTAANYDDLIDHPVEMGAFTHATFDACGVTHHLAITGRHRADIARLCADLKKICEAQIRLFEPVTAHAPMAEYWFLIMAVGDGHGWGGLEHRASTALMCDRDDLPLAGQSKIADGYRRFLGLASHEYFHTWNVKRIKPEAFANYDLSRENYTRQLWFFEGFTSYYDDLILARTGLIEPVAYLELAAENIGRVLSRAGHLKQSVAESSFDAWVKYYRQDENSPNAIVSYYQKGAMVALALDLTIRQRTLGKCSLDDVMRALWEAHGKTAIGVPEGGVQRMAEKISGMPLGKFFAHAVEGTADLEFAALFESVAIEFTWKFPVPSKGDSAPPVWLGAKIGTDTNGDAKLVNVFDDGAAQLAGLSAGDVIIAVDGLRVTGSALEKKLRSHVPGARLKFSAFRRDELMTFDVTLQALPAQICALTMRDTPIDAKARRNAWLMG